MQQSNDIVINPLTQRPIKKSGRVYMQLVHDGVLQRETLLKNELTTYEDESADEKIDVYNDILKEESNKFQAVKGRGKHINKIVVRRKQITTKQPISKSTSKYILKEKEEDSEMSEIDFGELEQPDIDSDE
jgi:hypothetical protein